jgi:hybrid cluster-associated redox disulfide protein
MREKPITQDMPVEEVMRRFPATIGVFLRHRMHCIGCAIGPFHSVADAAHEYRLVAASLLDELREAASRPDGG